MGILVAKTSEVEKILKGLFVMTCTHFDKEANFVRTGTKAKFMCKTILIETELSFKLPV